MMNKVYCKFYSGKCDLGNKDCEDCPDYDIGHISYEEWESIKGDEEYHRKF